MMFMPYYFFFLLTLFMGSIMSLSSSNWLYVWMGLEINLLSFIPLIMSSFSDYETESALKYFLVQALGSSFILFGFFTYYNYPNSFIFDSLSLYILLFSLMIKMGMAPYHYWIPHVMGGISWISCMLLAVWQKIVPLFVLSLLINASWGSFIFYMAGLGSIVGGVGGMNQSQLRVLLGYSSIGHMGWMLAAMCCSGSVLVIYYLVYSVISLSIMIFVNMMYLKSTSLNSFSGMSLFMILFLSILFFSLAGLPPFLGFYPKFLVISELSLNMNFLVLFMLISGSVMNIYYYLNVFFNVFFKSVVEGYMLGLSVRGFSSSLLLVSIFVLSSFTLGLAFFVYAMTLFYKS